MLAAQAQRRIRMFGGLKAFSHRYSNQTSQSVPIDSERTITPGKLLNGRYKITQALGAGGVSQTYLAKDAHRPGNPTCVVKHFKPASSDLSFLKTAQGLFQAEAEILEEIGHHNQVPQLLAYFEENQNFYLVEEYVDGQLLSTEMLPGRCWSESQVIQLLQEVLDLLVFIHSHGVVHRDIKPDNLIRRRQNRKLVLIDFGTIKQVRTQTVTPQGHRIATTPIGTQGYMAAEQGQGNPRPSSDLYALGIISIQALTGLDPAQLQQDPDTGEICWQQQAKVSSELASIIGKLASYHFKDRYQSAGEVLEDLQPLVKIQVSNSPRHLSSWLETPTQKSSNSSIPLPEISSYEPISGTVFPTDPSGEPIDLDPKNKKWIWTGVGTGLASAVALAAVISSIPDTPMQSAAKPNNLQNTAKPDSSAKTTPVKRAATSSTPLQRELAQTTNARPLRTSEPISVRSEPRIARENLSSPTVERPRVITATANPATNQDELRSTGQQPSRSAERPRVALATTNQLNNEPQLLEALSNRETDQSNKETQSVSESNLDSRQAELKNLAALKVAFGKLANAIAVADETLAQGQDVTEETFNHLGEVITKMQHQVGTLPSKQQENLTTLPAISLNQKTLPSPDREVMPNEKLQEAASSIKQQEQVLSEKQEAETPSANSSNNEQELLPNANSVDELDASFNGEVTPVEELEEKATSAVEREAMSTPDPESTSETTSEEEQLELETPPANSSTEELSSEATSEEETEAITPAVSTEAKPSSEAVSQEQPKLSEEWMEEQNKFSSDQPIQQLEEEAFEETLEETAPTNSATDESELNSESVSDEEETASASEVISEEQLEGETVAAKSSVISPDGQFLAGTSENNTIKIWNVQTGELVSSLKGYSGGVESVAFSSDSQTLTITGSDSTTTTWNLSTTSA